MRLSTRFVAQDVMWQAAPVCELAIEGSFEQARIAYAVRTAIVLDLVGMDGERLDDGQIVTHSASFL